MPSGKSRFPDRSFTRVGKQWLAFLLAFVVPLVAVFWWWGGFSKVNVSTGEAGPYRFVCLDHRGDIANARETQKKVFDALKQADLEPGDNMLMLLTDPRTTPKVQQRAKAGYTGGPKGTLPQDLKEEFISRRRVLMARVKAGILIAPSKAYQALHDYLKPAGQDIRMPTLEIYRAGHSVAQMGELTAEMER